MEINKDHKSHWQYLKATLVAHFLLQFKLSLQPWMMWCTPDTRIWDDPYTNWEFWQTFKHQSLSIGWLPAVNQESGLSDVTLETPGTLLLNYKAPNLQPHWQAPRSNRPVECNRWCWGPDLQAVLTSRIPGVWLVQFESLPVLICGWNALV